MAEVKWIKIVTNIFDDEKIVLIEQLPEGYAIIVAWFKLLCLAGKQNNSGVFMMSNKIPYTEDMLATIFRMKKPIIQLSLEAFKQYGMIEIVDSVITIPNWSKHQTLDQIEERNEYMKQYMQKYREKQKLLASGKGRKVNSKPNSKANVNSLEEDREEELDKDKEINIIEDKSSMSVDTDSKPPLINYSSILKYWNEHSLLKEITAITDKRKSNLHARIKEHGIEAIYKMIDQVKSSSFLRGNNKQSWTANFDWCIRPNNFVKILEGNYLDASKKSETLSEQVDRKVNDLNTKLGIFNSKEPERYV